MLFIMGHDTNIMAHSRKYVCRKNLRTLLNFKNYWPSSYTVIGEMNQSKYMIMRYVCKQSLLCIICILVLRSVDFVFCLMCVQWTELGVTSYFVTKLRNILLLK